MPPWASANLPTLRAAAPVNAPFSCPKISLSASVSGSAPQSTTTKGPSRRALRSWIRCATRSLPVPLSPVSRTLMSPVAARSAAWTTACSAGLRPIELRRAPQARERLPVVRDLLAQVRDLERAPGAQQDLLVFDGLAQIVERALLHGGDRGLHALEGRDQDELRRAALRLERPHQIEPVGVGELVVEEDQVRLQLRGPSDGPPPPIPRTAPDTRRRSGFSRRSSGCSARRRRSGCWPRPAPCNAAVEDHSMARPIVDRRADSGSPGDIDVIGANASRVLRARARTRPRPAGSRRNRRRAPGGS